MRHNCIGGEHSIFQGIHKLMPGYCLEVSQAQPEPVFRQWWSAAQVAERGVAQPFVGSPEETVDALERLLKDAVGQQMMADVPLGAFLSGGIDSSTVVALMQAQSSRPVKTFSIGFHEAGYNEAAHAKAVAAPGAQPGRDRSLRLRLARLPRGQHVGLGRRGLRHAVAKHHRIQREAGEAHARVEQELAACACAAGKIVFHEVSAG
jgi:hypothetical protein